MENLQEEKKQPLTKEDVLELSRKENEKGDESDKQQLPKASALGFSVGLLLAGIVILVSALCSQRLPVEMLTVVAGMQAAQAIYVGATVKRLRKLYLTVGITECAVAVIFMVLWILELNGVAL